MTKTREIPKNWSNKRGGEWVRGSFTIKKDYFGRYIISMSEYPYFGDTSARSLKEAKDIVENYIALGTGIATIRGKHQ